MYAVLRCELGCPRTGVICGDERRDFGRREANVYLSRRVRVPESRGRSIDASARLRDNRTNWSRWCELNPVRTTWRESNRWPGTRREHRRERTRNVGVCARNTVAPCR